MKGIGLVFAGGGGKGAYEIGVWKYLQEVGLDRYVRAVSGTSVGALNAALFAGSNYQTAEKLWLNITKEKVLSPQKTTPEDFTKWLIEHGLNAFLPIVMWPLVMTKFLGKKGSVFSRTGLIEMISDGLDFSALHTSDIPCFVTCVDIQVMKAKRFILNDHSDDEITTLLLASSAIPVIFPTEEFHGRRYCDGGIPNVGDNVPIYPVYNLKLEHIIVVHLDRDTKIDKEQFPNAHIFEIVPSKDLGNLWGGTLDFSSKGAYCRLRLGYKDAKRALRPMVEGIILSVANQKMQESAQKRRSVQQKRQELGRIWMKEKR